MKKIAICICCFFSLHILLGDKLHAQVPVVEEPRHKVVLLNQYIRLLDVHIQPHDTTLYHRHSIPSAVIFITKNITGSQPMGGEPSTGQAIPGNTFFAGYGDKPINHRVWNQDSTVYHVMDIELLNKNVTDTCSIINNSSTQLSWSEKLARMYSIHVSANASYMLPSGNCPHLLVLISGSAEVVSGKTKKQMQPGDFIWCEPQDGFHIMNKNAATSFALLELKK